MDNLNNRPTGQWTYIALVLGAALGMFAGLTPPFNAAGGIFVRTLGTEFRWGRSVSLLSYSGAMLRLAGGSLAGWIRMSRLPVGRFTC